MADPKFPDFGAFPMPEMAEMPAPIYSPTFTTAPTREDPPLRSTCGNCNQAKVKCSKDRPSCRRCVARGTPCTYAVSMRGVKRPRPEQPLEETVQPEQKKKAPLPSPALSDMLLGTGVEIPAQTTYFPDWNHDLYSGTLVNDDLGMLPLNFDTTLFDPATLSYPLDLASTSPPPTQAFLGPAMPLSTNSNPIPIPLSPITPPRSRDGSRVPTSSGSNCISSTNASSSRPSPSPSAACSCRQTIAFKLTELGTPSPTTFNLDSFLAQHRANMSLCTTVLDCADPQHKPSLVLLMQLISLLFHMVASFDQILLHRKKRDSHSEGQLHPDPSYPSTPPSRHRKEQVTHANLLRAELAKLGAMIQQFDRKYCGLENSVLAEDTFLLSPLFVNLQWKTQAKFDAVRSWMPWL